MITYNKLFAIIGLISSTIAANAQLQGNTDYNIWNITTNDTAYIYGNMINVRSQPSLTAAIQDSLPCGTMLVIKANEKQIDLVKGIHAPWVKASYTANGSVKEGYIWLGLIALGSYVKDDIRFIYGIERIVAAAENNDLHLPATWHIKAKAVSITGRPIAEQEWKMDGPEIAATGGKLLGDMGLKNTTDILRVHFGGEACGVPTNYFYFPWTGKQLLPLPSKMEVGDAGVYYYTETYLFPKEQGGQPDKIIKLSEESEASEKMDKNGEPIFKTTKSRTVYTWNGERAMKAK